MVYPFKSNVQRISIAGNIGFEKVWYYLREYHIRIFYQQVINL
jgi:hypothetical protein